MRLLTDPPPDDVRDKMVEIFERSEFHRRRNLLERFLEWLSEKLGDLFGDSAPGAPTSSGWGGPIATILLYLVGLLALVALIALIVVVVRRWTRSRRPAKAKVSVDVEDHLSPSEWAAAAGDYEAVGDWKEALRCRYRELVSTLTEREVTPAIPGRTTGELADDVRTRRPPAGPPFGEATLLFEMAWYADIPTGEAENRRFKELATSVLDVTASPVVESPAVPPSSDSHPDASDPRAVTV